MEIPLDRDSAIPLYQQIHAHIAGLIQAGALPAHARLPATRQLAAELGVNRITVSNAYAELEAAGLVYAQTGRGTFVEKVNVGGPRATVSETETEEQPLWQQALAARRPRAANDRWHSLTSRSPDRSVISFGGGVPDMETFPIGHFRDAMQKVLRRDGQEAMAYTEPQGYQPLREAIARFLGEQGIAVSAGQVLVASGSQQAISLVVMTLLRAGDTVVVECPTYANALQLFTWLDVRMLAVPVDKEGMCVEVLEHLLQHHRPRLIYTIPTFHNPTGTTLSGRRRRQLLALAGRYGLPILEDDYIGGLRYDGPGEPSLKALDRAGNVIHASTFSKMLMPGPRVGFVLAEGPLLERLTDLKRHTDLGTSGLVQRAVEAYIAAGHWRAHTRRVSHIYRQRRDAMVEALARCFPAEARWTVPKGGFFVWVRLPDHVSISELYTAALAHGVTFAPGPLFFPGTPAYPAMRLSFAQCTPPEIWQGVERLAQALRQVLAGGQAGEPPGKHRPAELV